MMTCCSNRTADISGPDKQQPEKEKALSVTKVTKIARITGKPVAGETILSPNNTARDYDIGGTDLGIYWKMDDEKVGILFGHTGRFCYHSVNCQSVRKVFVCSPSHRI